MSIGGWKIRNKAAIHFITFAVVGWVDVFTKKGYCEIVIDSLKHCQQHKGLVIYAWCIMSNHLHLLVSAEGEDLSAVLRDFKKFTSKQIIKAIGENEQESRKEWMLQVFKKAGAGNTRNSEYQFWQQELHPVECYSPAFTVQKLNYIHNNPVAACIVAQPEDYNYSSAKAYSYGKAVGPIDVCFI